MHLQGGAPYGMRPPGMPGYPPAGVPPHGIPNGSQPLAGGMAYRPPVGETRNTLAHHCEPVGMWVGSLKLKFRLLRQNCKVLFRAHTGCRSRVPASTKGCRLTSCNSSDNLFMSTFLLAVLYQNAHDDQLAPSKLMRYFWRGTAHHKSQEGCAQGS